MARFIDEYTKALAEVMEDTDEKEKRKFEQKIERTLVRLKYSLAADDEIDALASVEDQVNDPNAQ